MIPTPSAADHPVLVPYHTASQLSLLRWVFSSQSGCAGHACPSPALILPWEIVASLAPLPDWLPQFILSTLFRSFILGSKPSHTCTGAHSSLERKVFFCAGSASGITPAVRFLLIYSSLGYGTGVPTPRIAADFAFPFLILRFAMGFSPMCWFSLFSSRFQSRHSLPLHSHGGLGPPSSYPWQFCRLFY